MINDTDYIKKTLLLAGKAGNLTFPNPLVGAILVKNNKIIGQGYHKKFGSPHAEVEAIRSSSENVNGSTLFVNLEPCCHLGKTPPCTELIIKSGIKKVVSAVKDPSLKVAGKGIEQLEKSGIEVISGVMENEARELNEAFFTYHEKGRPFIALKFASSLDGKIATHTLDSKWITNKEARDYARSLRVKYQAILVGVNTVIRDNPNLGVNLIGYKDPVRIILDSKLKIPLNAQVLRDNNIIIATTDNADKAKRQELLKRNISMITFNADQIPVKDLIQELYKREILSVFVEGGSRVLGSFVDEKLTDRVFVFTAPIIIGGGNSLSAIGGKGVKKVSEALKLKNIKRKYFGDNLLTSGYF